MNLQETIDYTISAYCHPFPIGVTFALVAGAVVKGIKDRKKAREIEARLPKIEPIKFSGPR